MNKHIAMGHVTFLLKKVDFKLPWADFRRETRERQIGLERSRNDLFQANRGYAPFYSAEAMVLDYQYRHYTIASQADARTEWP